MGTPRRGTDGGFANRQLDELSKALPELELDSGAFFSGRVAEVVEVVEPRSKAVDVASRFGRSGGFESRSKVDDDTERVRWRSRSESFADGGEQGDGRRYVDACEEG